MPDSSRGFRFEHDMDRGVSGREGSRRPWEARFIHKRNRVISTCNTYSITYIDLITEVYISRRYTCHATEVIKKRLAGGG